MFALYLVGAALAVLAVIYGLKGLAADLLLMGGAALLSLAWLIAGAIFLIVSSGAGQPSDPLTFWGYVATGLTLPLAGIYLSFLERTAWGSWALAVIGVTNVFLAYRLVQLWPEGLGA